MLVTLHKNSDALLYACARLLYKVSKYSCIHGCYVFDWLSIEQDFGYQLPIISDVAYQRIHLESGEASALSQPTFQHRGSFCDVVSISIRGSVLK